MFLTKADEELTREDIVFIFGEKIIEVINEEDIIVFDWVSNNSNTEVSIDELMDYPELEDDDYDIEEVTLDELMDYDYQEEISEMDSSLSDTECDTFEIEEELDDWLIKDWILGIWEHWFQYCEESDEFLSRLINFSSKDDYIEYIEPIIENEGSSIMGLLYSTCLTRGGSERLYNLGLSAEVKLINWAMENLENYEDSKEDIDTIILEITEDENSKDSEALIEVVLEAMKNKFD